MDASPQVIAPAAPAARPAGLKSTVDAAVDSLTFGIIMTLATIYSLFGEDVRMAGTTIQSDVVFLILAAIVLALFLLEILLRAIAKSDYLPAPALFTKRWWVGIAAPIVVEDHAPPSPVLKAAAGSDAGSMTGAESDSEASGVARGWRGRKLHACRCTRAEILKVLTVPVVVCARFLLLLPFGSFYFWLDLLAAVSMALEIPHVLKNVDRSLGFEIDAQSVIAISVARAGRASRAGARAGRLIRLFRLVRLLRGSWTAPAAPAAAAATALQKQPTASDSEGSVRGGDASAQTAPAVPVTRGSRRQCGWGCGWGGRAAAYSARMEAAREALAKETRVGATLTDLMTRRVIIGVLLVVVGIPLLTYKPDDSSDAAAAGLLHATALAAIVNASATAAAAGGNGTVAPVEVLQSPLLQFTLWQLMAAKPDLLAVLSGTVLLHPPLSTQPASGTATFQALLQDYRVDEYESFAFTSWLAYNASAGCYQLPPLSMPQPSALPWSTRVAFSTLNSTREASLYGVGLTLFILVVLAAGSAVFSYDAHRLVLRPLEKMVEVVRRISFNPLAPPAVVLASAKQWAQWQQSLAPGAPGTPASGFSSSGSTGYSATNNHPLFDLSALGAAERRETSQRSAALAQQDGEAEETRMLLRTLLNIGSLLRMGFGDAGAAMLTCNLNDSKELNPIHPGVKRHAVYAYIRFTHMDALTAALKDETVVLLNAMCSVIHEVAVAHGGLITRNSADGVLLTWVLPDDNRTCTGTSSSSSSNSNSAGANATPAVKKSGSGATVVNVGGSATSGSSTGTAGSSLAGSGTASAASAASTGAGSHTVCTAWSRVADQALQAVLRILLELARRQESIVGLDPHHHHHGHGDGHGHGHGHGPHTGRQRGGHTGAAGPQSSLTHGASRGSSRYSAPDSRQSDGSSGGESSSAEEHKRGDALSHGVVPVPVPVPVMAVELVPYRPQTTQHRPYDPQPGHLLSLHARRRLHHALPGVNAALLLRSSLHVGWSVEGAVGSDRKLDMTYTGPHVSLTSDLTSVIHKYEQAHEPSAEAAASVEKLLHRFGFELNNSATNAATTTAASGFRDSKHVTSPLLVLFTHPFYALLSAPGQGVCRHVDRVVISDPRQRLRWGFAPWAVCAPYRDGSSQSRSSRHASRASASANANASVSAPAVAAVPALPPPQSLSRAASRASNTGPATTAAEPLVPEALSAADATEVLPVPTNAPTALMETSVTASAGAIMLAPRAGTPTLAGAAAADADAPSTVTPTVPVASGGGSILRFDGIVPPLEAGATAGDATAAAPQPVKKKSRVKVKGAVKKKSKLAVSSKRLAVAASEAGAAADAPDCSATGTGAGAGADGAAAHASGFTCSAFLRLTDPALRSSDAHAVAAEQCQLVFRDTERCYAGPLDLYTYDCDLRLLRFLGGEDDALMTSYGSNMFATTASASASASASSSGSGGSGGSSSSSSSRYSGAPTGTALEPAPATAATAASTKASTPGSGSAATAGTAAAAPACPPLLPDALPLPLPDAAAPPSSDVPQRSESDVPHLPPSSTLLLPSPSTGMGEIPSLELLSSASNAPAPGTATPQRPAAVAAAPMLAVLDAASNVSTSTWGRSFFAGRRSPTRALFPFATAGSGEGGAQAAAQQSEVADAGASADAAAAAAAPPRLPTAGTLGRGASLTRKFFLPFGSPTPQSPGYSNSSSTIGGGNGAATLLALDRFAGSSANLLSALTAAGGSGGGGGGGGDSGGQQHPRTGLSIPSSGSFAPGSPGGHHSPAQAMLRAMGALRRLPLFAPASLSPAAYSPLVWKTDILLRYLRRHAGTGYRYRADAAVALLFGEATEHSDAVRVSSRGLALQWRSRQPQAQPQVQPQAQPQAQEQRTTPTLPAPADVDGAAAAPAAAAPADGVANADADADGDGARVRAVLARVSPLRTSILLLAESWVATQDVAIGCILQYAFAVLADATRRAEEEEALSHAGTGTGAGGGAGAAGGLPMHPPLHQHQHQHQHAMWPLPARTVELHGSSIGHPFLDPAAALAAASQP